MRLVMTTNTPYGASVRLRKRADGTTAADVRYRLDGNSTSTSFDTPAAAEKWAKIVRSIGPAEALRYLRLDSKAGTPTIDEYAETYINSKSGVEPKTLDHYRMFMRLHIGPTLGHLPMDAVSAEAIAAWVNMKQATGASSKTIQNWHGFLSGMYQHATTTQPPVVTYNPCARTRLPQTERLEMVFLSPDEFTELLSYIPERWQPLVLALASTGMRWGEATALRPTDFDLDAEIPTVRVSRAWKSSKERGWYIGPPKTRRSVRTVSIPDNLVPILRPLVTAGNEYVFVNALGRPVRNAKFHESVWQPALKLANGLPPFEAARGDKDQPWSARSKGVWEGRKPAAVPLGKHPRVHDLRHSHVAWLLGAGVGIDVISRRIGHESIQTTVDVYGHISVERAAGAGMAVGRILSGAMPQLLP